jgi:hypothetical protein
MKPTFPVGTRFIDPSTFVSVWFSIAASSCKGVSGDALCRQPLKAD